MPLILLLSALFATLLPSWNLGFVSDDYGHLVEAAKFSPISSTDGLHRPLRNIAFKIAHATFGLNPAPYHLVLISLHLVLVGLLYRFVLLLGGGRYAAFIAAAIFGFFPRNHQSLFWVAAGQDTVVAICSLVACSAFLLHKGTGRSVSYFIALASFSIALGFKETATAILPLLLLVDLSHRIKNSNASPKHRWRAYVPFVIIAGAYLVWVFGERLFGPAEITQSFYRFQNASQSVKLAAKFILNMLLPLSSPVEVKEVVSGVLPFMTVSLGVLTIAIASFWLVRMDKLALTTGWILISMAPTAVFGFYTDRYLLMPFLGMAMLLGFIAEAIVGRARTNKLPIGLIITAALFLYVFASIARLSHYRRSWREAAVEIQTTMSETRRLYPGVPDASIFYFVNLTHSKESGQVYIFNTSVNGALWTWGYDRSVTAQRTFSSDNPHEQELVGLLLACKGDGGSDAVPANYILIFENGLIDVSGDCADRVIAMNQKKNPDLWK
ncbi:MAG TPA: hypothetical protein DIT76_06440 [Spartobacteria bacterium]|nr:hypothetical protein [Spartobacteria bacterium]